MPLGDGSGPYGLGPGTGRGKGKCGIYDKSIITGRNKWLAIIGMAIYLVSIVSRLLSKKNKGG
ncbi:MAG: DUF5320 domain-containing protein [Elusimicrobiota bacterium]